MVFPGSAKVLEHVDAVQLVTLHFILVSITFGLTTTAFMYLIPVFASLWTLAVLGRAPEAIALPGGLLVVAGVAVTQRDRSGSGTAAHLAPPVEAEAPVSGVTLPR
jgi:hypothetical protein